MRRLAIAAAVLAALAAALVLRPAFTAPIASDDGIATLASENLNGRAQWVLTRGLHRDRPVVLFLHGGPGMSAMYLAHASTRSLERDFVVVHWDRRDAGKSFDPAMNPDEERVSVQLRDAEELIGRLRERFGGRRVLLVGHSWGTQLGVLLAQRHPDWLAAYVGVGQIADPALARAVADRFLLAEAVQELAAPVFVAAGRHDYNTPSELAAAWLERLDAPCKELFWFERSAHFPFLEEPERFAEVMRQILATPCVAERL